MTYKIGIIGSPASGKSTLSCRLTGELMERGMSGARMVTEYAIEHLGKGNKIESFEDQALLTKKQIDYEKYAEKCTFNPIICDSAIWIGKVYVLANNKKLTKDMEEYLENIEKYKNLYDMTIYVPLFSKKSELNTFRVHDSEQAMELDKLIKTELKGARNVIKAPKSLKDRESFIKYISGQIIDEIS
jgi:ribosome-binding ATPase YchF (GTP1/OBG family)